MCATLYRTASAVVIPAILFLGVVGCTRKQSDTVSVAAMTQPNEGSSQAAADRNDSETPGSSQTVEFKDQVRTNAEVPAGLDGLVFFDTSGKRVALANYLGNKNIVLVFTEGFSGVLCPFCKTQTSRLVDNYDKFRASDAEVLVVYPGTRDHVEEFIEAAKKTEKQQVDQIPFPIVLDEQMTAVDFFRILRNLAHPSTYVIDKAGNVRLAYVGKDMSADRPSVSAILAEIEAANK